ncbi:AMP-binding protein [Gordonia sp. PDNC005]|nr:AMP-binding protein [Gordonia sp. PDNC005]
MNEVFERSCDRTPSAVALVCGDDELTYAELDEEANQLAHALLDRGVGVDSRVGILLHRSIDTYAALLGVQKAGAAFVPIDPRMRPPRSPRHRYALRPCTFSPAAPSHRRGRICRRPRRPYRTSSRTGRLPRVLPRCVPRHGTVRFRCVRRHRSPSRERAGVIDHHARCNHRRCRLARCSPPDVLPGRSAVHRAVRCRHHRPLPRRCGRGARQLIRKRSRRVGRSPSGGHQVVVPRGRFHRLACR